MSSNLIQLVFRDSLANSAVKIASFFVKQPAVLGRKVIFFLKVDQKKKFFFVELNLLMEIVTISHSDISIDLFKTSILG